MILITKKEAYYLRDKGKGKDIIVSSKTHNGKAKRYYLTESKVSLDILSSYRKNNLVSTIK